MPTMRQVLHGIAQSGPTTIQLLMQKKDFDLRQEQVDQQSLRIEQEGERIGLQGKQVEQEGKRLDLQGQQFNLEKDLQPSKKRLQESQADFYDVEVSKGKYKYVDITATKSAGRIDPSTGRTTTESVSIKAQIEPKPRTEEFFKTLEITEKPKTKLILKEGKIQRVTLADTYSFEGKKVKFDSKNLPTYDSLMDVVKSSKYKK